MRRLKAKDIVWIDASASLDVSHKRIRKQALRRLQNPRTRVMKRILFLQDLRLSREDTCLRLKEIAGNEYETIWFDSPHLQEFKNSIEILVTCEHEVSSSILKEWPKVKMISLAFTGYDKVDLDYAHSKGIEVYYVPGYATASVAELNLALTLSILRKIPTADRTIREGKWHDQVYPGIELGQKTVGIVGTGTIGLETGRLFRAFGCSVIGWSRTLREEFIKIGGAYVSEKSVFSESDILVLCLALNHGTRHFVCQTQLEWMKEGSILINTARSELIDKAALLPILKEKRIFAGIDAFDDKTEKRGMDQLFEFENVVLSPHLGFKTKEALNRLAEATIKNIGHFLVGSKENLLE